MAQAVVNDFESRLKKTVESLRQHLATFRTGRASPGLVEHLMVEAYGSPMPLNQIASVSVPEARAIVIQPYDANMVKAIEKAIQTSELGLNPNNDGRTIRLNIPPLTEERRKDLVKQVRHRVEEAKVAARNLRREANDQLKKLEHDKAISADEHKRTQERIQQITDRYSKDLETIGSEKEAEVMEV